MAHKTIHSTRLAVLSLSEMKLNRTSICSTLYSVIMMAKSTSKIVSYIVRIWTNASLTTPRTSARASSLPVSSALNNQVLMLISTSQSNTELMLYGRRCELKRTLRQRRTRSTTQRVVKTHAEICEPSPHSQTLPVRECLTVLLCKSTKKHSARRSSRGILMKLGATFPCAKPLWPPKVCEWSSLYLKHMCTLKWLKTN